MQTSIEDGIETLKRTRPFASPCYAAEILECSRYSLFDHVQNGDIPLAFDIAAPGATRLCLRMASASVLAFRTGLKPSSDLAKFLDAAFPGETPIYRAPRLAWILHCDYDHIYHLLASKALADAGGATRYQIPRESIIEFLTRRRVK